MKRKQVITSVFDFLVPEYSLNPGQFYYFHNKEVGENEQILTFEDIKRELEMDEGTVYFSLQISNENPAASHLILSNSKRSLDFDPVARLITFEFLNSNGTPTGLKLPIEADCKRLAWNFYALGYQRCIFYQPMSQKIAAPSTFRTIILTMRV